MSTALTSLSASRAATPSASAGRLAAHRLLPRGFDHPRLPRRVGAPTPLYAMYRAQWGFSPTMLTVVFAIYASPCSRAARRRAAVGPCRPPAGADRGGMVQALMMVTSRQPRASGICSSARTCKGCRPAPRSPPWAPACSTSTSARGGRQRGRADARHRLGGAVAGLMVQYLPAPTHLVYEVLGVVFVRRRWRSVSSPRRPAPRGALASLRPTWRCPGSWAASSVAPAVVAVWSLAGFYASLGPTLVASSRSALVRAGGLALFVVAGSGASRCSRARREAQTWSASARSR